MGYDGGDSFPFNFEPNRIPFGSKSKGKLSPRSYPFQFERKLKHSFLSVPTQTLTRTAIIICGINRPLEIEVWHWAVLWHAPSYRGYFYLLITRRFNDYLKYIKK